MATKKTDTMQTQEETSKAVNKARNAFRKLLVGDVSKKADEIRALEDSIAVLENAGQQDIAKHAFIYIRAAKEFNAALLDAQDDQEIKTTMSGVLAEMKALSGDRAKDKTFTKLLRRGIRQACLCIEKDTVDAGFVMETDTRGNPTGRVSAPQNQHVFKVSVPETDEETGKTVMVEKDNPETAIKVVATSNVDDVWKHFFPAAKGADQNKGGKSGDATDGQNPDTLSAFMALAEFITGKSTGTVASIDKLSKVELQAVLAAVEIANIAQVQAHANGEDKAGPYIRALIDNHKPVALDAVANA